MTQHHQPEPTVTSNGVPSNDSFKKNELNNNHLPLRRSTGSAASNLSKAKSEGNLSEELENSPPINYDEMPIKPAKGGQYFDELSHSIDGYGMLAKKSTSHHSLPITTANHVPVKNSKSVPSKKNQTNGKLLPSATSQSKSSLRSNISGKSSAKVQPIVTRNGGSSGPKTVQSALKRIESEDWNDKVDGINLICELSASNPKEVADNMHEVVMAVLSECKNLRSSVSRAALTCIGALTQNMKAKMDVELDKLCTILINKAGDVSNAFIREDASEALEKVVKYASASKALQSIIAAGSKSKNNTIRASCAGFVGTLVSRVGAPVLLASTDQLARLIPQLIAFCRDANAQVRMHGKQILVGLSQDPSFDKQLKKAVSDSEYRTVKEILEEIGKKGGIDSLESTSTSLASALSRTGSVRKTIARKLPDNVQLDLDEIRADLTAAGWERRIGGLKRFLEMTLCTPKAIASDTKLIEAFIGRLSDINSKVALEGLDTYLACLPMLSKLYSTESHLKAILNQLLFALMSHLSSKSDEHRTTAQKCLRETVKQIDPASLSPAMAAATRKANIKQKPFMLTMFNRLNFNLYPTKPKQVEVVALPILWECLKAGVADSEIRKAVTEFAKGLQQLMGERALLDQASMEVDPPRKKLLESLIR
ncbi:hypothetical protein RB195_014034 [Necator americanus]